MKKIKRVLVTGNLGYIGSILTPLLEREGYEVIGLDAGFFEDAHFVARPKVAIRQIKKDVRAVTQEDLEGVDALIHLAALSDDPQVKLGEKLMMDINAKASVKLAKLAKKAGVKRFLFSSSCSTYGKADSNELVSETSKPNPVSPYGVSKVEAERGIGKLADKDFCPVFLRNATCYGISPRMRFDLVVNNLMGYGYTTGEIKILSDGTPWRPVVHIEDVAGAFIAVLKAPREHVYNEAFNVGQNEENYQIREIADMIAKVIPRATVNCLNATGPDKRSYRVNFDKIRERTDFHPRWQVSSYLPFLYKKMVQDNFSHSQFMSHRYHTLNFFEHLIKAGKLNANLRWL